MKKLNKKGESKWVRCWKENSANLEIINLPVVWPHYLRLPPETYKLYTGFVTKDPSAANALQVNSSHFGDDIDVRATNRSQIINKKSNSIWLSPWGPLSDRAAKYVLVSYYWIVSFP